jgi:endonuclease G
VDNLVGEPLRSDVNEGVRISAIVKNLRAQAGSLSGRPADALRHVLQLWSGLPRSDPVGPASAGQTVLVGAQARESSHAGVGIQPRAREDGTVTWTIPLELSVRLPFPLGGQSGAAGPAITSPPVPPVPVPVEVRGEAAAPRPKSAEDFSDRNGYEPGFIQGFVIAPPDTSGVA